jgi:hypothetical protein
VISTDAVTTFEDQQLELRLRIVEGERDQRIRETSADQDAIHSIAMRHRALLTVRGGLHDDTLDHSTSGMKLSEVLPADQTQKILDTRRNDQEDKGHY